MIPKFRDQAEILRCLKIALFLSIGQRLKSSFVFLPFPSLIEIHDDEHEDKTEAGLGGIEHINATFK